MSESVPVNPPIEVIEPIPATNEAPPIASPMLAEQLPPNEPQIKPARLLSLDVFRGITLAMMTLVNNEGTGKPYWPLDHADWGKGWTPTDLVFPFFLFIVGVAIPFSLNKRSSIGQNKRDLLGTIWTRALSLFMVGQLLPGIGNLKPTWFPPDDFVALPPEFHVLHVLRWVCVIFAYASVVALLIPWRPTRRGWLLPVGICVSFYSLALIMAWANHYALTHGAPSNTYLGSGLLHPGFMRIPGILQRIGFCYGVGATILLYAGWRTALLTLLATCSLYTVLMFKAPFHDLDTGATLTGLIEEKHNFARSVDQAVFDKFARGNDGKRQLDSDGDPVYVWRHAYGPYPDNEGIVSTLPAIANVLIGGMAGLWLRSLRPAGERCSGLFVFGVIAILFGYFLDAHSIPINKTIWTPAYAIFTAGLGLVGLGVCFYIVDIHQYRRWAFPFVVFGMNSIAVFVANSFVYRVITNTDVTNHFAQADWNHGKENQKPLVSLSREWHLGGVAAVKAFNSASPVKAFNDFTQKHVSADWRTFDTPQNTSLAYAASFVIVIWLLMLILYACKIFVKI